MRPEPSPDPEAETRCLDDPDLSGAQAGTVSAEPQFWRGKLEMVRHVRPSGPSTENPEPLLAQFLVCAADVACQ